MHLYATTIRTQYRMTSSAIWDIFFESFFSLIFARRFSRVQILKKKMTRKIYRILQERSYGNSFIAWTGRITLSFSNWKWRPIARRHLRRIYFINVSSASQQICKMTITLCNFIEQNNEMSIQNLIGWCSWQSLDTKMCNHWCGSGTMTANSRIKNLSVDRLISAPITTLNPAYHSHAVS